MGAIPHSLLTNSLYFLLLLVLGFFCSLFSNSWFGWERMIQLVFTLLFRNYLSIICVHATHEYLRSANLFLHIYLLFIRSVSFVVIVRIVSFQNHSLAFAVCSSVFGYTRSAQIFNVAVCMCVCVSDGDMFEWLTFGISCMCSLCACACASIVCTVPIEQIHTYKRAISLSEWEKLVPFTRDNCYRKAKNNPY